MTFGHLLKIDLRLKLVISSENWLYQLWKKEIQEILDRSNGVERWGQMIYIGSMKRTQTSI